jgi:hypothetical protein
LTASLPLVLATKVGLKVGGAEGLAILAAVAGATVAGKPALISAVCTVLTALVNFVPTVAAFKFVTVTTVVITTPATRIRRPIMIIYIQNKPTFLS